MAGVKLEDDECGSFSAWAEDDGLYYISVEQDEDVLGFGLSLGENTLYKLNRVEAKLLIKSLLDFVCDGA